MNNAGDGYKRVWWRERVCSDNSGEDLEVAVLLVEVEDLRQVEDRSKRVCSESSGKDLRIVHAQPPQAVACLTALRKVRVSPPHLLLALRLTQS